MNIIKKNDQNDIDIPKFDQIIYRNIFGWTVNLIIYGLRQIYSQHDLVKKTC